MNLKEKVKFREQLAQELVEAVKALNKFYDSIDGQYHHLSDGQLKAHLDRINNITLSAHIIARSVLIELRHRKKVDDSLPFGHDRNIF